MIHELKVSKSKLVMMRNVLKDSMDDHNGVKVFQNLHLMFLLPLACYFAIW